MLLVVAVRGWLRLQHADEAEASDTSNSEIDSTQYMAADLRKSAHSIRVVLR